MIRKLTLKNFRNFCLQEFFFSENENIIIWKNWKWKTNILEAIGLFAWLNLSKLDFENIVSKNKDIFYIEINFNDNIFSISYDKTNNKKIYQLNKKRLNKQKFLENSYKVVYFSPISMNLMYLSPSLRRDFLDEILGNCFLEYNKILKQYKKILSSRNKILKNISIWESKINELNFWNEKFSFLASIIYYYRFLLTSFLKENTKDFTKYFSWKIKDFNFEYKSKIKNIWNIEKNEKINEIQKQINQKLQENQKIDLYTKTTNIGPHLDDFDIYIDDINLINFASRWEVKSIILWLKFLEISFLEKYNNKKPILLIDDLLSELDEEHKNLLLNKIKNYQSFITSIRDNYNNLNKIIKLN